MGEGHRMGMRAKKAARDKFPHCAFPWKSSHAARSPELVPRWPCGGAQLGSGTRRRAATVRSRNALPAGHGPVLGRMEARVARSRHAPRVPLDWPRSAREGRPGGLRRAKPVSLAPEVPSTHCVCHRHWSETIHGASLTMCIRQPCSLRVTVHLPRLPFGRPARNQGARCFR